ncbi:hypothetical protein SCLCIDRAFT_1222535 [Scleroderma citrinum Foug A]|uniref:Uncharacterized protein n=1 Tax=Scleroderma citrinum Foug A TaxID=1036808 RepID=A0A0C2YW09_9AGAM|nr:hypothetical protein SCLCIDRAFT_1222535 [Scleroderma citrinum Foug A]
MVSQCRPQTITTAGVTPYGGHLQGLRAIEHGTFHCTCYITEELRARKCLVLAGQVISTTSEQTS